MTAALIGEGALALALLGMVVAFGFVLIRHHEAEAQWTDERRELINRIQRPDYLPVAIADPERFALSSDDEPDQIDLINTIADPIADPILSESDA